MGYLKGKYRGKNHWNHTESDYSKQLRKCSKCKKIITGNKYCQKCYIKTLKGRIITWGNKISKTKKGHIVTEKIKRKIGKTMRGKTLEQRGHIKSCQCSFCKAVRGEFVHKKNCQCSFCKAMRGELRGKNNGRFGKSPKHSWKGNHYKNIWMRSSWEIAFAHWLDLSGYRWDYESRRFDLKILTYCPDFYLPNFNCYIEIKGWADKIFEKKLRLLNKLYPQINIKILYQKELINMGVLSESKN